MIFKFKTTKGFDSIKLYCQLWFFISGFIIVSSFAKNSQGVSELLSGHNKYSGEKLPKNGGRVMILDY